MIVGFSQAMFCLFKYSIKQLIQLYRIFKVKYTGWLFLKSKYNLLLNMKICQQINLTNAGLSIKIMNYGNKEKIF